MKILERPIIIKRGLDDLQKAEGEITDLWEK